MLVEKLQEGLFARLMSKNEDIRKTKRLMQQRLSNGAPSPKLSKMLEILVDHFKVKDPRTSLVIIFSNFRGSVREDTKRAVTKSSAGCFGGVNLELVGLMLLLQHLLVKKAWISWKPT